MDRLPDDVFLVIASFMVAQHSNYQGFSSDGWKLLHLRRWSDERKRQLRASMQSITRRLSWISREEVFAPSWDAARLNLDVHVERRILFAWIGISPNRVRVSDNRHSQNGLPMLTEFINTETGVVMSRSRLQGKKWIDITEGEDSPAQRPTPYLYTPRTWLRTQ